MAKVSEFQLQYISNFNEQTELISFRMDWLDRLAFQGLSKVFSNTTFKSIKSLALSFLYSPTLTSIMTTGKTIALTRWTFVSKVMSLLFNMLPRLAITFLPMSKHLLISWLQSPSADFGAQKNKVSHYFHCFTIYLSWSDVTGCHGNSFLNVEF